jgi:hypothetical protein
MAFLGQDPSRYKIIVDNICKEFYIFSCEMSYENEKDFNKHN